MVLVHHTAIKIGSEVFLFLCSFYASFGVIKIRERKAQPRKLDSGKLLPRQMSDGS